ncbi:MAG: hypothetical protein M1835_005292 [Candelina submexicana]|nr:MAG: hypothetical protein M1835_005292 [Candelina submexicana]
MLCIFTSINRAIQHARLDAENERLRRAQEYRLPNLRKGVGEAVLQRRERKRRAARKSIEAEHSDHCAPSSQAATARYEDDDMAGRYIPPHLRNKENVNSANGEPTKPEDELYTLNEIISQFGQVVGKPGTLNASESKPDTLAFILVFREQHPNYHSRGEIFCKSNLHLLPHTESDTTAPNPDGELVIPVFEQDDHQTVHSSSFKSLGWHHVTQTTYLEPRGGPLVAMLEAKFRITRADGTEVQKTREAQRWQESLAMRWAVVTLDKAENFTEKDPMEGCVREERKGVNELMREMRLAGAGDITPRGPPQRPVGRAWGSRTADGRNGSKAQDRHTRAGSEFEESIDSFGREPVSGDSHRGNEEEALSDTWSLISTGPIDKTYTMVHETKDEET